MADNAYEEIFNCDVIDVNGDRVGSVGQVYLDDQTGQPSWVTVKTGLFGLKETFVPLEQAIVADGKIATPYASEKIKEAPRVDPDKHLDADEEAELYDYYGIATVVAVEPEAVAVIAEEAGQSPAPSAAEKIAELDAAEAEVAAQANENIADSGESVIVEELNAADAQDTSASEMIADLDAAEAAVVPQAAVVANAAVDETAAGETVVGETIVDESVASESAGEESGDDDSSAEPTVAITGEDLYDAR